MIVLKLLALVFFLSLAVDEDGLSVLYPGLKTAIK